jgi:hypothetical protein
MHRYNPGQFIDVDAAVGSTVEQTILTNRMFFLPATRQSHTLLCEKSFTDPRTGGPTCKTNEIIYDAIYASLPDDCKLTFAQMFENFDDLCPFKAPLSVNGEKFDFEKHVLNLLTDAKRAEWWRLTVNHLKWKYIDAIKNGVKKPSSLFLEGCLKRIGRLSTRKLCRLLAITSIVPRSVWWSACSKSLLAIISHRCSSVEKTK